MKEFVKLTNLNGTPLYLAKWRQIDAMSPHKVGKVEFTKIECLGGQYDVIETPEEIAAVFEAKPLPGTVPVSQTDGT